MANLITCIVIYTLMPMINIWFTPSALTDTARLLAFMWSVQMLWMWTAVLANFDFSDMNYQFQMSLTSYTSYYMPDFSFGVDGFSLSLILLTAMIMPVCIYASVNITKNVNEFLMCLLLIELFLMMSFYTTNLLFFFVFFESVLMPMFLMMGYWGSSDRKMKAAYYFFFYTLFGSLFMLFGIIYLWSLVGSLNYTMLSNQSFSIQTHLFLFILFFLPFAIKIPMFPFHIWLPEAHVEAPTMGSMILASLLLKLGSYGFLKFTMPLFWYGVSYFSILVDVLAVLSIIYASLITLRQIDLKKIIAYSSMAHMNLIVLGLFSLNQHGIDGAIYLMIGHGIVSSALFFLVGMLYDRYHTRLLKYYSGLVVVMPIFTIYFFMFTLANMSFPGTSNFIGEFVMLLGVFNSNSFMAFCGGSGIVLSALYSIWLFNRVCFGTLKMSYIYYYCDVTWHEFQILFTLTMMQFMLGMYSKIIFDLVWWTVYTY